MNALDANHAVWASVVLALAKFCLPWFARQGEKLVDALCKTIEANASTK